MNDACLLRKSLIYVKMQENPNFMGEYFILGDSSYPSLSWIVPPFTDYGNLTKQHREFNYFISATRNVVENAFGLLKGRFRRLRRLDNVDRMPCSKIILCCILHNICIDENGYILEMAKEDFLISLINTMKCRMPEFSLRETDELEYSMKILMFRVLMLLKNI